MGNVDASVWAVENPFSQSHEHQWAGLSDDVLVDRNVSTPRIRRYDPDSVAARGEWIPILGDGANILTSLAQPNHGITLTSTGFLSGSTSPPITGPNGEYFHRTPWMEGATYFASVPLDELLSPEDAQVGNSWTMHFTSRADLRTESVTFVIVPEPSTASLLALAGLAGLRRVRRS